MPLKNLTQVQASWPPKSSSLCKKTCYTGR